MTEHLLKPILSIAALIYALGGTPTGAADKTMYPSAALTSDAVTRTRTADVIAADYRACLESNANDSVRIWVFFTDKGVTGRAAFESAASTVTLTERAKKRRAKVDLDSIVFADLPVASQYLQAVENLGARLSRSSRWLNAASFVVVAGAVSQIESLPFVAEIKPVARYQRPLEVPDQVDLRELPSDGAQAADSLSYGASYNQLNQIGVITVHEMGYTGAGVTLTIIDAGFRTSHAAFAAHYTEGRVLAEYDFVQNDGNVNNQAGDWASEWNHGTNVWSIAGGAAPGYIYGPAFGANFILAKTENVAIEMRVEEDNWVAAMEWADSIGTDVITSSLGYLVFDDSCHCSYSRSDMNGQTAITSIAASMADGLGIVLCKSAGNDGPSTGTITAPGDAFDILTVGSVNGSGVLASSSSRGPTADGRMKPEVCARGVSTTIALASSDNVYGSGSGTSYAAPLVAGAVCLVIEAHPDWTPAQVREALKMSGSNATTPDNNYGWGVIRVDSALRINTGCCTGKVGNVNGLGDDVPTIGDIALLIDFLFIAGTPPNCMAEADINQSGGANPLSHDITIGDISILIDHLYINGTPLLDCL
jgi:serine protease AprX